MREQVHSVHAEKRPRTKDGFIYGYSHFTQKKDSNSKRGYEQVRLQFSIISDAQLAVPQKSVVILTQHQFPALFSSLISVFGPLFQNHGLPMLEAACHNIATWCVLFSTLYFILTICAKYRHDPTPGSTLELGFLGVVLCVELPLTNDEQQFTETSPFVEKYDPRHHVRNLTFFFAQSSFNVEGPCFFCTSTSTSLTSL